MPIIRLDIYVAVSDIEAAQAFYERVFERAPALATDNYVGFEIDGALFGLFREDAYSYPLSRGNSATPNILVTDIEAQFARIRALKPPKIMDKITSAESFRLFMFTDPDGNVIEFYERN